MLETVISLEVEWDNLHLLEQQLLHAVSQLPKKKIDELQITMGRSTRGFYLRLEMLPLVAFEDNSTTKIVSCQLTTEQMVKCNGMEFEQISEKKRIIGVNCCIDG